MTGIIPRVAGVLDYGGPYQSAMAVYDIDMISPTITTAHIGIAQLKIEVRDERPDSSLV